MPEQKKIRLLPLFIFIAALSLSLRVSNLFASAVSIDSTAPKTLFQNCPENLSSSEIELLKNLSSRKEIIDARKEEIDRKAIQLQTLEEDINKKIRQLQEYETKLKPLIAEYNAKKQEKLSSLVRLYSNMKPRDAARILETLDTNTSSALLKDMRASSSSAILSQMSAEKAREITTNLMR